MTNLAPVHIVARGAVRVGKSVALHEIYIALKAVGIPVEYANESDALSERRMVDMDAERERLIKGGLAVILHEANNGEAADK